MASLYAYFDESGTEHQNPIVAFNGLVDSFDSWRRFGNEWARLLRGYRLTEFHTTDALRYSLPYGTMKPGTVDDRIKDILPFVRAIADGVALGIVSSVKVSAYQAAHPLLHQAFGKDPIYFCFQRAVFGILDHWAPVEKYDVGLILDDQEAKVLECYRLLKKMKLQNQRVRKQITSICFSDDKSSVQLQATDLFCYFNRIDAEQKFFSKAHAFGSLCDLLFRDKYPGKRLSIGGGGLFDEPYLIEFLDGAIQEHKQKSRREARDK
jgi:hypothetical protein